MRVTIDKNDRSICGNCWEWTKPFIHVEYFAKCSYRANSEDFCFKCAKKLNRKLNKIFKQK